MSSFSTGIGGAGHGKPYKGDALAALGLGFANFINGVVIRHPFVVLRRQCQIHDHAYRKHFFPTTLVPVIIKLTAKDGFLSLWKGAVGNGVLWAFSSVSELVIAELLGLPKSFVLDGSSQRFWRHVWLKTFNFIFCTPVIVTAFLETVRTGTGLAEDLQIAEIITKGYDRLRQDVFGGSAVAEVVRKRHSLLWLAFPTSLHQTMHFLVCQYVYTTSYSWTRTFVSRKLPSERRRYHTIMPELFSSMTSVFVADIVCYPLETVLHRLYIQGTRTLVDNLDNGAEALVPAGRYSGIFDCFSSIITKEGVMTLFSGIGAIFLQYMLQHCVAGITYWLLDRGSRGYTSGHLKIKMGSSEFVDVTNVETTYDPFAKNNIPQNPSAQFAATSQNSHPSTSGLFPSFAQVQKQNKFNDDPFLSALQRRKTDRQQHEFDYK
uniref:Solute carrier family 25 member 46 n=2 Tax=Meloidogyne TaxID=189290 RepID=A0A914MIL9_MELIC